MREKDDSALLFFRSAVLLIPYFIQRQEDAFYASATAVSYTHLDVYKRQGGTRPPHNASAGNS